MIAIDLSVLREDPNPGVRGKLFIEALSPLSMVESQPGTYFVTSLKPGRHMIRGLLENAFGWHFNDAERKEIYSQVSKDVKKANRKNNSYKTNPWLDGKDKDNSGSTYYSLLRHHVDVLHVSDPTEYQVYDDLWSMHLRDRGMNFYGGSRSYDYRLEELITKLRTKTEDKAEQYELGDRKGFEKIDLEEAYSTQVRKIHTQSVRDGFPEYYVSPKKRGYVLPEQVYECRIRVSHGIANLLDRYAEHPCAPLYLGNSEGWINLKWNRDEH
ncbi:MAG: type I-PGING CRISPR-associated protein Cas5p [Bacteroidota bacterium]